MIKEKIEINEKIKKEKEKDINNKKSEVIDIQIMTGYNNCIRQLVALRGARFLCL